MTTTTKSEAREHMEQLFDELVPACGKSDNKMGEIIRAFARINYRYLNDGDKIGQGYGNETCNAAARYLMANTTPLVVEIIGNMWGRYLTDARYEEELQALEETLHDFICLHPELREADTEDMWDHFDKAEDRDDEWEDDEWDEGEW